MRLESTNVSTQEMIARAKYKALVALKSNDPSKLTCLEKGFYYAHSSKIRASLHHPSDPQAA
jgi:hypothetical protein